MYRLEDIILKAVTQNDFDKDLFLDLWFQQSERSYFFLFWKNFSVTNIQIAELIALIKRHAKCTDKNCNTHTLFFHTQENFAQQMQNAVEALLKPDHSGTRCSKTVARLYGDLIKHSIVVRPFYCSCAVAVPPNIELPIEKICGESGYVHSCGRNVYIEPFATATKAKLFPAIQTYVGRHRPETAKRVRFIPYTHEDFSDRDRKSRVLSETLNRGLDGVKLRISKLALGSEMLADVLRELGSEFSAELVLVRPHETVSECDGQRVSRWTQPCPTKRHDHDGRSEGNMAGYPLAARPAA